MKTPAASLDLHAVRALFAWGWVVLASAAAAGATGVQPELSISLRGTSDGTIEVGEPFRVAVRVEAPADAAATLQLAPAQGSWISATTIEILSANERIIPASARVAAPLNAKGATIVDADNPATALWWFPAESLNGVVPGEYSVRVKLAIREGTGWKGEVTSEPASLRVVPPSTDPDRVVQRRISHARAAILAGEPAKAAEILNAMLETDPDNISALVLHAALSLQGGNRVAARICLDRALALSARLGGEPSAELNELAMRIELAVTKGSVAAEVPAWTRPPRTVFEPLRAANADSPVPTPAAKTVSPVLTPATNPVTPRPAVVPPATTAAIAAVPAAPPANPASELKPAAPATRVQSPGVVVPASELSDAGMTADPAGQWAVSATAGSQYGKTQYSAAQATGAPNVGVVGNSPDAWCPAGKNAGSDWLELSFAKPVHATEVRVRQNDAAGAIAKLEAFEPDGTPHVWWEGVDPFLAHATRDIVWFAVRVPKTAYVVAKVKLTLNLAANPGWKEIDAVQLVGAAP